MHSNELSLQAATYNLQHVTLGTRGSALARVQTTMVREALSAAEPQLLLEEKIITTIGDAKSELPLHQPVAEGSGLFTRQLEEALLAHEIDAAVHSLKDLPVITPQGLRLAAILPRANVTDVLITQESGGLQDLPAQAVVGTSSPRRLEWMRAQRSDLVVKPIRGNVPTRLRKLKNRGQSDSLLQKVPLRYIRKRNELAPFVINCRTDPCFDGIILARAGLERLGFDLGIVNGCGKFLFEEKEFFVTELTDLLPAPGQGAVAVETRAQNNSASFENALKKIHHEETACCVTAERLLLQYLGGGCHMALGALATMDPSSRKIHLRATYVPFPSAKLREGEASGPTPEEVALRVATQLGEKLAEK
ncbi:MAG: hydroxymethylbilane synthase [Verrucomicrobia bacterium]|nr:hydroxymethylbilane synthase [Verrucomicrobiota bacterium]